MYQSRLHFLLADRPKQRQPGGSKTSLLRPQLLWNLVKHYQCCCHAFYKALPFIRFLQGQPWQCFEEFLRHRSRRRERLKEPRHLTERVAAIRGAT